MEVKATIETFGPMGKELENIPLNALNFAMRSLVTVNGEDVKSINEIITWDVIL